MAVDTTRTHERDFLFIDGDWTTPAAAERTSVVNCFTEAEMGRVPRGTAADAEAAVRAARAALPGWSALPPAERARYLRGLAEALRRRREEIIAIVSHEVGTTRPIAEGVHTSVPVTVLESMAELAETFPFEERIGPSTVQQSPVGVVVAITPWNYPLHQLISKLAPALAAGCTTIAKPADLAPLTTFIFAECAAEAGLPPGVFNLVSGPGPIVGEALASHPEVDMVSFTGSTRAGRRVATLAAERVKRVALELGGKSPNILLEDLEGAALEEAVRGGLANCYRNTGQTCTSQTRMLVHQSRHDEATEIAAAAADELVLGDPVDPTTTLGPLVSDQQRTTVRGYIEAGLAEGAKLVAGGAEPPELPHGYFVKPTVFAGVDNDMKIAREEIFGPVLAIVPYRDEDDAVRIANDSEYGLSGGVWAADPERAMAVASRLEVGQVMINGAILNPLAPFGGFKQSGLGRELGEYGFREFLEPRSIQVPVEDAP